MVRDCLENKKFVFGKPKEENTKDRLIEMLRLLLMW